MVSFVNVLLYFIEIILVRLQNTRGDRAALFTFYVVVGTVRRECEFYGPFSLLYLLLEMRKCRPTAPDAPTEKTGRSSDSKTASLWGRRPGGDRALTCVNDLDVCWGQRRATFIVTTEAVLCCIHFRCVFFSFFSQELQVLAPCAHQMFTGAQTHMPGR